MVYPSRFVEFFGPAMWKTMHAVSFTFPDKPTEEQKKQYTDFFTSLGPVIPCPSCAKEYQEYVKQNPIKADDADSLARWVYKAHDNVNKRNKKTSPSFEAIKRDYTVYSPEDYKDMSQAAKTRYMADPHLGRLESDNTKSMFMLFFFLLALAALFFFFRSRS